jgi:hypothetical protein
VIKRGLLALVFAATLAVPRPASAHDIPARVLVRAFVKPAGQRLSVIVRVPLEAMRDVKWPVTGEYLDIARADSLLAGAARLWIANYLELHENDTRLPEGTVVATRISLPSDAAFRSYDDALHHFNDPRLTDTDLVWQQALLDVRLEYTIASEQSRFSIRPALAHLGLRTTTVLRFLPPGRGERAFEYIGDPGLVRLDPRWHQAAWRFVELGFAHIMSGFDHLLFILCLVIPFRRIRPLIAIVTSFTVAHSITLIASALGFAPSSLWFPPLIEVLIALSIVYMAFENIVGAKVERRWLIAFGFGLVHGFGFSFALRNSLQFAGAHLATSLFSFNIGVELGQLAVLAVLIPALGVLFRYVVAERVGTIILSALVAHTAWHWLSGRAGALRQYRFQWPALDLAFFAGALRALMVMLVIGAAVWLLVRWYRRLLPTPAVVEPDVIATSTSAPANS